MSEAKPKVMIIERRLALREALEETLASHLDVTVVGDVREASEKAENEDFKVIVTGCVLPQMLGKEGIQELKTLAGVVAEEKAALLKRVRDAVQRVKTDFESKTQAGDEILRQAEAKQDKLLEMLNGKMRQLEGDNVQLTQKVKELEEANAAALKERKEAVEKAEAALSDLRAAQTKMETTLAEKAEAEKQVETALLEKAEAEKKYKAEMEEKRTAEEEARTALKGKQAAEQKVAGALDDRDKIERQLAEATGNVQALREQSAILEEELTKSLAIAQAAINDKSQIQKKLARLQENWEKHIAGR